LDIAFGNWDVSNPNRIYKNEGAGSFSIAWNAPETSDQTEPVAWGDYDNDGNLDLAVGNYNTSNRVYRNEGGDSFTLVWSALETGDLTCSLEWADYDNDGVLDMAVGNLDNTTPNRVYKGYFLNTNNAPSPPPNDADLSISFSTGQLHLQWSDGTDPEGVANSLYYKLFVATESIATNPSRVIVSSQMGSPLLGPYLRPKDISLTPPNRLFLSGLEQLQQNNTYYFSVATIDAGLRTSAWSVEKSTYVAADGVAPSAITNLSALISANPNEIDLSWTSTGDDGASGLFTGNFKIGYTTTIADAQNALFWSTATAQVTASTVGAAPNSLFNLTLDGLSPGGATYYFRLWAQDDASLFSTISNGATGYVGALDPPTNLQFTIASSTDLTASWTPPVPAGDSYLLEISTDSGSSPVAGSSNTVNTNALIPSLSPNTTYYGRVRTIINGSSSTWTSTVTTATLADIPATAGSTWTAVNVTSLTVAWNAGTNPVSTLFEIEISTDSGFFGGIFGQQTTNSSHTFMGLTPGATYFGQVKAINHSGISSAFQFLGSTLTKSIIPPSNLYFSSVFSSSFTAFWNASTPPGDSYTLELSTNSGFVPLYSSNTTPSLFTNKSSLTPNTTYFGRVLATVNSSSSNWSDWASSVTLANQPVSTTTTWSMVEITSLTVAWADAGNSTGTLYQVELSSSGLPNSNPGNKSSTTTVLTTSFTSLIPGIPYFAHVQAINHDGISTSFHDLGSTTTKTVPVPSGLFYTSASITSLTAQWNVLVPAPDFYTLEVSTDNGFPGISPSHGEGGYFNHRPSGGG